MCLCQHTLSFRSINKVHIHVVHGQNVFEWVVSVCFHFLQLSKGKSGMLINFKSGSTLINGCIKGFSYFLFYFTVVSYCISYQNCSLTCI